MGTVTFLPDKWLKYELLDLYGLAKIEDIQARIHRFSPGRQSVAVSQLKRSLQRAARHGDDTLFVAKFVPRQLSLLLPNVRIRTAADLDSLERAIRARSEADEELWFCETNVGLNRMSVAGRLSIDLINGVTTHTIEQVWRCSPRLIETLSSEFPLPFIRATRSGWKWAPRIEHVHIPPDTPESATALREQFADALLKFDQERERFEVFVEAIHSLDLGVCLEYKVENDRLQIIDWDTANDSKVLRELLRK